MSVESWIRADEVVCSQCFINVWWEVEGGQARLCQRQRILGFSFSESLHDRIFSDSKSSGRLSKVSVAKQSIKSAGSSASRSGPGPGRKRGSCLRICLGGAALALGQ